MYLRFMTASEIQVCIRAALAAERDVRLVPDRRLEAARWTNEQLRWERRLAELERARRGALSVVEPVGEPGEGEAGTTPRQRRVGAFFGAARSAFRARFRSRISATRS